MRHDLLLTLLPAMLLTTACAPDPDEPWVIRELEASCATPFALGDEIQWNLGQSWEQPDLLELHAASGTRSYVCDHQDVDVFCEPLEIGGLEERLIATWGGTAWKEQPITLWLDTYPAGARRNAEPLCSTWIHATRRQGIDEQTVEDVAVGTAAVTLGPPAWAYVFFSSLAAGYSAMGGY